MKVPALVFSVLLAAGISIAQMPLLPDCAQSCATDALTKGIGNCGTDPKCICENKGFLDSIACCVEDRCDEAGKSSAITYATALCAANDVHDIPTTISCSTGAKPTTTTTSTPTGSGTAAADSSTITSAASSSGTDEPAPSTSTSGNHGPRQTAAAGLGAIGGIVAAVAML